MLAREVSFFTAHSGDSDGALLFQKPDHRRNRVLGCNRAPHVHVVRHQMPFDYLAVLLLSQRVEDRTQLPTRLAEEGLASSFGHEYNVVLASNFEWDRL